MRFPNNQTFESFDSVYIRDIPNRVVSEQSNRICFCIYSIKMQSILYYIYINTKWLDHAPTITYRTHVCISNWLGICVYPFLVQIFHAKNISFKAIQQIMRVCALSHQFSVEGYGRWYVFVTYFIFIEFQVFPWCCLFFFFFYVS